MDGYLTEDSIDNTDSNCSQGVYDQIQANSPYVRIVEQPAKCGVRFRYECEGRISGAIPGVNSTTLKPTYPTIRLFNYCGRAKVVVSCVTKSEQKSYQAQSFISSISICIVCNE